MIIVETRIYELGKYTIQERPRQDNPAWAVYIVILREKVIGKQFSVPSMSDCEWLSRQKTAETVYALPEQSHKHGQRYSINSNGRARNGRPAKRAA